MNYNVMLVTKTVAPEGEEWKYDLEGETGMIIANRDGAIKEYAQMLEDLMNDKVHKRIEEVIFLSK